jgi:hypothetical protein
VNAGVPRRGSSRGGGGRGPDRGLCDRSFRSKSNDRPATGPRLMKVSSVNFRYHGFPKVIHPGLFHVAFTNQEGLPFRHEMVVVSLQPG